MKTFSQKICFTIALLAMLAVTITATLVHPTTVYAINDSRVGWEEGVFNHLDYGIYWYQNGKDIPVKAGSAGVEFDPTKPTIIFTHGMKYKEGYNRRDLLSTWEGTYDRFDEGKFPYSTQYYQKYIDMGYNVGHFYWNQIAEENIDGDPKIWSSDTPMGMRYYVSNSYGKRVQGDPTLNPTSSVSVLYAQSIIKALGKDFSGTLQLAGHSMGGDLSLAVGENLLMMRERKEIGSNLIPQRITLLDPYLSNNKVVGHIDHRGGEDSNGRTIAELCSEAVVKLADYGVAIEGYGAGKAIYTMYATLGGKIYSKETMATLKERFGDNITWVHLNGLDKQYGIDNTHNMVPDYYFLTLFQDAVKDDFGQTVPSALMDVDTLRSLKGVAYSQQCSDGNSVLMKDCTFARVDRYQKPVNLTMDFDLDNVYGISIKDTKGNVVYSRSSNQPITHAEVGLPEGKYSITLTQQSNVILFDDQVAVDNQVVSCTIDYDRLTNFRVKVSLAVIIPAVCVSVAVAVAVTITKKKKKSQQ